MYKKLKADIYILRGQTNNETNTDPATKKLTDLY